MSKELPTFLIDTSEKERFFWEFDGALCHTEHVSLETGDYSIKGAEQITTIDRKSVDDFVSSVIHDWARFRKCLRRMAAMDMACIAVEANIGDVIEHKYHSETRPDSVIGRAHSIYLDYGIAVNWWGNRQECIHTATRYLLLAHRRLTEAGRL